MSQNPLVKQERQTEVSRPELTRNTTVFTPRVDIVETEDELLLLADMPGVNPDDVNVHFENGELAVHGKCEPRQHGVDYLSGEYGVGDFYRAFTLNEAIDADKITAELKHGVLTVHLPKSEAVKPRKIAVKAE